MQQTCAPLGRPRQSAATHPTDAAGPTTAKHKSNNRTSRGRLPQAPTTDGTKKPASTTTDWFVPAYAQKTYRDVDTGVSWDAP